MLAIASLTLLSACTAKKSEEVTLQVKTQYGVLEGIEEDGVKKMIIRILPFPSPWASTRTSDARM